MISRNSASHLRDILRISLLYSLICLTWYGSGISAGLMETGIRPAWWYVVVFEFITLLYFSIHLHPSGLPEKSLKSSLLKGMTITTASVCLIPSVLIWGMFVLQFFPVVSAENLTLFVFGPTQPVLFTLIIALISGLFSTLLSSGIYHMKRKKPSAGGKAFDIFFSFSKMNLGEGMPSDGLLYANLFRQIQMADQLGFKRAWVGEAHFSIKTEQHKPEPLLPHFNGELCINTDILQIASVSQPLTRQIEIGSAIRNILVNGGPVAHAEAIRTFLTLHHDELKKSGRKIQIGFGVGRFAYANEVYGVKARNEGEEILWPAIRGLVLRQATEIFLRLLKGEILGSSDISPSVLQKKAVKNGEDWSRALASLRLPADSEEILIPPFWEFQSIKIIPEDCDLSCLELTLGSHDPDLQVFANQFLPVKVFNLSVTPGKVIDETHVRMTACFHADGGPWKREYMPRTIMIFTCADKSMSQEEQDERGFEEAKAAMVAYWQAMEGTVDQAKVEGGMENAVYGSPAKVKRMLDEKFHPEDRLMTWFDFNTNDAGVVTKRMEDFMLHVKPLFDA